MRSWDSASLWEHEVPPLWRLGWVPKEEVFVFREAGSEAGRRGQQAVVRECLLELKFRGDG